jgi:hypothetical protein
MDADNTPQKNPTETAKEKASAQTAAQKFVDFATAKNEFIAADLPENINWIGKDAIVATP